MAVELKNKLLGRLFEIKTTGKNKNRIVMGLRQMALSVLVMQADYFEVSGEITSDEYALIVERVRELSRELFPS